MSTLVVCVDREGDIAAAAGSAGPIVGREALEDLVTEVGLEDPEDSRVNCLLETLQVERDLDEEGSIIAVLTSEHGEGGSDGDDSDDEASDRRGVGPTDRTDRAGSDGRGDDRADRDALASPEAMARLDDRTPDRPDAGRERAGNGGPSREERRSSAPGRPSLGEADRSGVGPDRAIARQIDALIARYEPEGAIVVIDSTADERLVPIIESRVRVDAVDRVVVRQSRDIESAYYLLKQFLANEDLRQTVLVPIGLVLLVFPLLLALTDRLATAIAAIAGLTGSFLLYKGLGVDDLLGRLASQAREALYSGQVSVVTYVVAVGLALVGVFAGAIAASSLTGATGATGTGSNGGVFLPAMNFAFEGLPWFVMAALVASAGRLLDEALRADRVRRSSLNIPFGVVAVGLVLRGFTAYFLERSGIIGSLSVPSLEAGVVSVHGFALAPGTRLAVLVIGGVLVSVFGVQLAARADTDDPEGLLD